VLNTPRELVVKVWVTPEHLAQWWGPHGFTNTFHKFDLKRGGLWEFTMHGPNGVDYPNKNKFIEVIKPEKIVIQHMESPKYSYVVMFEDAVGKTKLTVSLLFESVEECEKVRPFASGGSEQNIDRLETELTNMVTK